MNDGGKMNIKKNHQILYYQFFNRHYFWLTGLKDYG